MNAAVLATCLRNIYTNILGLDDNEDENVIYLEILEVRHF